MYSKNYVNQTARRGSEIQQNNQYIANIYVKNLRFLKESFLDKPEINNDKVYYDVQNSIEQLLYINKLIAPNLNDSVQRLNQLQFFFSEILKKSVDLILEASREPFYLQFFAPFYQQVQNIEFIQSDFTFTIPQQKLDYYLVGEILTHPKPEIKYNGLKVEIKQKISPVPKGQTLLKNREKIPKIPQTTTDEIVLYQDQKPIFKTQLLPFPVQDYTINQPIFQNKQKTYFEFLALPKASSQKTHLIFLKIAPSLQNLTPLLLQLYLQSKNVPVRKITTPNFALFLYKNHLQEQFIVYTMESVAGNLQQLFNNVEKNINEEDITQLIRGLFEIVSKIHENQIAIRDVRPPNFVWSENDKMWKFNAFNCPCSFSSLNEEKLEVVGAVNFMSPQLFSAFQTNQIYGKYNPVAADYFALGIIALLAQKGFREITQDMAFQHYNYLKQTKQGLSTLDIIIKLFLRTSEQFRLHHTSQEIITYINAHTSLNKNLNFFKKNYYNPEYQLNQYRTFENQLNLARYFLHLQSQQKCIESYLEAIKNAPDSKLSLKKAKTCFELGYAYFIFGHNPNALQYYQQSVNLYEQISLYHYNIPAVLVNIGMCLYQGGYYSDSLPVYKRALKILERIEGNQIICSRVYDNLGNSELELKLYPEAEKHYFNALELKTKQYGPKSIYVADTLINIGLLYKNLQKYDKSHHYLKKAYSIQEINFGRQNIKLENILSIFGEVYIKLGQTKEGINCLWKVYSLHENYGFGSILTKQTLRALSYILKIFEENLLFQECVKVCNQFKYHYNLLEDNEKISYWENKQKSYQNKIK